MSEANFIGLIEKRVVGMQMDRELIVGLILGVYTKENELLLLVEIEAPENRARNLEEIRFRSFENIKIYDMYMTAMHDFESRIDKSKP